MPDLCAEINVSLPEATRVFPQVLTTNLKCKRILIEQSQIKCHENPFSRPLVLT